MEFYYYFYGRGWTKSTKKSRNRLRELLYFCKEYVKIKKTTIHNLKDGVIRMSIVAGLLVCAFVYVIRASLVHPGEEDWRSY
ncbi:hypothetical protein QD47_06820 [Paenibacillus terrae]|uniref:Uncharacterized protein n=1 Tax=Paenibacillus terrae TaxID=159743 RepID=A0A0D7X4G2_9BACL|nr:hypothetical protein QD47_06820 [Paenibacillus terrae]